MIIVITFGTLNVRQTLRERKTRAVIVACRTSPKTGTGKGFFSFFFRTPSSRPQKLETVFAARRAPPCNWIVSRLPGRTVRRRKPSEEAHRREEGDKMNFSSARAAPFPHRRWWWWCCCLTRRRSKWHVLSSTDLCFTVHIFSVKFYR